MGLRIELSLQSLTGNKNHPTAWFNVLNAGYTHNIKQLWQHLGIYEILYETHGQHAGNKGEKLEKALRYLIRSPKECSKFDDPNGWGDHASALHFLREVTEAFKKYPFATISISK